MADYYPLIARAVEGLGRARPKLRRAVYDRAPYGAARRNCAPSIRRSRRPTSSASACRSTTRSAAIEAGYRASPRRRSSLRRCGGRTASAEAAPIAAGCGRSGGGLSARSGAAAGPVPIRPPPPASSARLREDRATEGEDSLNDGDAHAPQRERPRVESRRTWTRARGAAAGRARALAVLLAVAAIAVTAWLLRDEPRTMPRAGLRRPRRRARPTGDAKFGDRVAGERAATGPSGQPAQPAPGAASRTRCRSSQRARPLRGEPGRPQTPIAQIAAASSGGSTPSTPGRGEPLETVAVRAEVEISERESHAQPR